MKELHQKQRNRQISGSIRSRHHQTNNNESKSKKGLHQKKRYLQISESIRSGKHKKIIMKVKARKDYIRRKENCKYLGLLEAEMSKNLRKCKK